MIYLPGSLCEQCFPAKLPSAFGNLFSCSASFPPEEPLTFSDGDPYVGGLLGLRSFFFFSLYFVSSPLATFLIGHFGSFSLFSDFAGYSTYFFLVAAGFLAWGAFVMQVVSP